MSSLVNPLEVLSRSQTQPACWLESRKSVVSVKAQMSRGTGIVLTSDGYILTCNHVLAGCSTVKIGQGERAINARIVGTDPFKDIALLKAEGKWAPIELGDSEKLNVGQYVFALANPFNRSQPTATMGIITNANSTYAAGVQPSLKTSSPRTRSLIRVSAVDHWLMLTAN